MASTNFTCTFTGCVTNKLQTVHARAHNRQVHQETIPRKAPDRPLQPCHLWHLIYRCPHHCCMCTNLRWYLIVKPVRDITDSGRLAYPSTSLLASSCGCCFRPALSLENPRAPSCEPTCTAPSPRRPNARVPHALTYRVG